jgi:predicted metal-dependent hydrolase
MSSKSPKIAGMIEAFRGHDFDAHYLAFFDCFNRQLFYEAHDVLEEMWLPQKQGTDGSFYKGLIQLAGAFVHLQKQRLPPAAALLKLSRTNLRQYPQFHQGLQLTAVWALIDDWLDRLEHNHFSQNPLTEGAVPRLEMPCGNGGADREKAPESRGAS